MGFFLNSQDSLAFGSPWEDSFSLQWLKDLHYCNWKVKQGLWLIALFQMLEDSICMLKGSNVLKPYLLIVIANILLTNNKEKENYNNNNNTSVIDDDDYGSMSNNNPLPIFCVSLFQIPMFYFCVFVRQEGLGDFFPSVSQPQKISMKGSLEKCWNCWWLLWWDGVCISRNSNVLLKNCKSSAKPSLKSAPK